MSVVMETSLYNEVRCFLALLSPTFLFSHPVTLPLHLPSLLSSRIVLDAISRPLSTCLPPCPYFIIVSTGVAFLLYVPVVVHIVACILVFFLSLGVVDCHYYPPFSSFSSYPSVS